MKTHKILLFLVAVAISSCNLLQVDPQMSITDNAAIGNATDLQKAVIGCYDALQESGYYGREFLVTGDLAADNLKWTGTSQPYSYIVNHTQQADNTIVEAIWGSIYDGINRVNNVLYRIEDVPGVSAEEINSIKGEMRFLRGLHYFNLVQLFGAVPYRDAPTLNAGSSIMVSKSSIDSIYARIIRDLTFAAQNIEGAPDGHATAMAAKALLSKVYLTRGDYTDAFSMADDVIKNGGYVFEPVYEDIFTTNSKEIIFQVSFNAQDNNRLAQYFAPKPLGGREEFTPADDMGSVFPLADIRYYTAIGPDGQVYKYRDIANGTDKVIVLRLADIMLVRSEALAHISGSLPQDIVADINTIRGRAQLGDYTGTNYLTEILLQRRLEFAYEGQRWFDLVRTANATSVLGIDQNHTLFPIPLSEILNNDALTNADQNPGY